MGLFVPDSAPPVDPTQKALHFVPPNARERRAQAVHRLQVGLFGLAGMLLLVGLANIIMDNARISDDAPAAAKAASRTAATVDPSRAEPEQASDPLADIGVVPDLPAATESKGALPPRAPANGSASAAAAGR